ncbi:MAG: SUMF1/EgtB/PvdO family nonheme iron enzyme [Luteolibacter sp.]
MKTPDKTVARRFLRAHWVGPMVTAISLAAAMPSLRASDLITNGSFENDLTGWTPAGSVRIQTAPSYQPADGSRLVSFNAGNAPTGGSFSQSFPTVAGQLYRLEFKVGVLGKNSAGQLLGMIVTSFTGLATDRIPLSDTPDGKISWIPKSYFFVANSGVTNVEFRDYSSATINIDTVLDQVTVTPVTTYVGLGNPGFEADLQGWTSSGNVRVQSLPPYVASEGTKLAVFNGGNQVPDGVLSQQYYHTVPGISYQLDFDMGILAYRSGAQTLNVGVNGNNPLVSQTLLMNSPGDGKVRWERKQLSFVSDSTAVILVFRDASAGTNGIDLLLDHLSVIPSASRTLTVQHSGIDLLIAQSVPIQVAPPDRALETVGSTPFVRSYDDGTQVNLTAPASFLTHIPYKGYALTYRFQNWLDNGASLGSNRTAAVNMNSDRTLTAVFGPGAPIIAGQPASATVFEGGSVTFRVAVDAPGTPIQWLYNGQEIPGAYEETYTIARVEPGHAGAYSARAADLGGSSTSDSAVLTVIRATAVGEGYENGLARWSPTGSVRAIASPVYQPTEGSSVLNFNAGNASPNGVVSRTFDTLPGTGYLLSLDMGTLSYVRAFQRLQVNVSGNTVLSSMVFSIEGNGSGKAQWKGKGLYFTADSARTTVVLRDVSPTSNSIDLMVDNFKLAPLPAGFAFVQAGTFMMGSNPDDYGHAYNETLHSVTFAEPMLCKKTEVNWSEWNSAKSRAAALGYNDLPAGRNGYDGDLQGKHPVTEINWWDAIKWCNLASEIEGLKPVYHTSGNFTAANIMRNGTATPYADWAADGYRLPTESEWEYVCKAGTTTIYFTGSSDADLSLAGWYSANSGFNTHPGGMKLANAWGISDTLGNVWEWCWDYYGEFYPVDPVTDPRGPDAGPDRVIRGGSFHMLSYWCRSSERASHTKESTWWYLGFRPVRGVHW